MKRQRLPGYRSVAPSQQVLSRPRGSHQHIAVSHRSLEGKDDCNTSHRRRYRVSLDVAIPALRYLNLSQL
jgi:hypothetical protein